MSKYTIELTNEEEKALLTDMISVQDWIDNAIHNKARQCREEVCRQALEDKTNTILTAEEKQSIADLLATESRIVSTVKQLPVEIQNQIVSMARIKTAEEKGKEFLARHGLT